PAEQRGYLTVAGVELGHLYPPFDCQFLAVRLREGVRGGNGEIDGSAADASKAAALGPHLRLAEEYLGNTRATQGVSGMKRGPACPRIDREFDIEPTGEGYRDTCAAEKHAGQNARERCLRSSRVEVALAHTIR